MKYSRGRGRQRTMDTSYQRLRGPVEGNAAFLPPAQTPRPFASDDPFRVSTDSPGSVSRFSNKRELGEGNFGVVPRIGSHSSPASSGVPRTQPYPANGDRDGSSSAVSSISPAPSSTGQSSAISAPPQFYCYPYAVPVPYGYPPHMFQYAPPMQPAAASRDGSEHTSAMPWIPAGQMQKASPCTSIVLILS